MAVENNKNKSLLKEGKSKIKKRKLKNFGLKKITIAQLFDIAKKEIRKLNFKIGELTSENDELKHELEQIKKKEISAFKSELLKKDIIYLEQRNKIKELEKKLSTYKKSNDSLICQLVQEKKKNEEIKEEKIDNVNKVETKQNSSLEKGKWYVCNTSRYTDFIVGKAYYCPKNGMLRPNENEMARYVARNCFHLWSIADAKDGDILVDVYGNIGIYQKHDDFDWRSYYYLGCDGKFRKFIGEHEIEGTSPATKEQCDILFQKIYEL